MALSFVTISELVGPLAAFFEQTPYYLSIYTTVASKFINSYGVFVVKW